MTESEMENLKKEFAKLQKQVESSNDKINKIYEYILGDGKFEKDGAKAKVDLIYRELPDYLEMKPALCEFSAGHKSYMEVLNEAVEIKTSKKFFKKYASEISFFMALVNGAIALYLIIMVNFIKR